MMLYQLQRLYGVKGDLLQCMPFICTNTYISGLYLPCYIAVVNKACAIIKVIVKVKLSHYTPWRHIEGEEV
jgi:hypothetical protein